MAARAAVRDAGRAMGFSYSFCDEIAKLIPPMHTSIAEAIEQVPELAVLFQTNADARKLLDTAKHLEGVARHASVHACGTVIAKDPLTRYVPLQFAPQDKTRIITQFEMHAIEDLGLLKIDFLGLKNLTIIQDTLRLIEAKTGERIDLSTIPLGDAQTFALLQEADNVGVFQFECLSGDTIVSNTTIKRLYEKHHKTHLQSVYVDEGKVRRNAILGIAKSGTKEVYNLVAENGWHIKASKDHQFLTDFGWKRLEEIRPGDRVLMKMNAKHLIYNTCQTCHTQIDGQKEGVARFCYSCSARFYGNPSKSESRVHMKESRRRFFDHGGTTWNRGLTTENSDVLRETGKKISKALWGRSREELLGKERAEALRKAYSLRFSGSGNPMFGRPSPHRKGGLREDLGHYVRSNWEADFARILNLHHIAYEYEPRTFTLVTRAGEILHYTPDFYVPSTNTFYEIKGWLHDLDQQKMDLFQEQYPQYQFVLINKTRFAELAMHYHDLIAWECPQIPVAQHFDFIPVKEIISAGEEETYDIAMQAPGNNFVANGFVVHNSSGMRRYMKELHPTEFEDLIALVALFRPGPMELIPSYIKRKHGEETVTYLHPKLEPILKNTYGIGVYQEQMMRIARDLAGYTLAEADTLRKAIGKKIKALLDEQQEKLTKGMIASGIEKKTAHAIWELFPPFARYGFNRSHAACYALIGYQTAYLKAHFPEEYMASLLNSDSGDIERISFLIAEAKIKEIAILPPDVNQSSVNFTPEGPSIRFGLLAIKNVGAHITEVIIEDRARRGPFKTMGDFLSRINDKDLNKKSLESLIKAGCFDSFGLERNQLLQSIDELLRVNQIAKKASSPTASLFGEQVLKAPEPNLLPTQPATPPERLKWEKELLGFYLSSHPLEEHRKMIEKTQAKPISEVLKGANEYSIVRIAGVIEQVKKIQTKKGDTMLFATVQDFSPEPLEVVVFSNTLSQNPQIWEVNTAVVIEGKISLRNGEKKFIAEKALKLA
jgi:hypothetical protein